MSAEVNEPEEPPLFSGLVPLAQRLAARPSTALFALLFGVYAYFYQAGGWNQNSRFDMVRALVEQGTFAIDRYEKNTGDDSLKDGHYYCDKAPGASWSCVPVYLVAHQLAGAPDPVPPGWLAWAVWLSIVVAVSLPSAIAATFLARLLLRLGLPPPAAYGVTLLYGLGTMALPYSTLLYGNQLSGSLLLIAFALLVEVRQGEPATPSRMIAVGVLLGYAVVSEYPAALAGMGIALYGLSVTGLRRALPALLGGLVPIAALGAYHWAVFGSPTAFPYDYSVWETPHTGWFMGIGRPRAVALSGMLFGEYRGLLHGAPWLVAALPGAVLLARHHRRETAVAAWVVLTFVWLNASIPPWHGGWAAGPRYMVPMLPFASVLAAGCLSALRPKKRHHTPALVLELGALAIAGLLGLVSAGNMFAVTAVKPELPMHYQAPYRELVWPSFRKGELAISTQSIDMIDNPPNAPRQAWNLGMKLGLDGHASLLPLYLWLAGTLGWLVLLLKRARTHVLHDGH